MSRDIIINGIKVIEVEESFCNEYETICKNKIADDINELLQRRNKHKPISTKEDLTYIEERIKSMHYKDVKEYIMSILNMNLDDLKYCLENGITEEDCPCEKCINYIATDEKQGICAMDSVPIGSKDTHRCFLKKF